MTAFQGSNHVLFAEPFEDTSFATRGWYDSDGGLAVDNVVYSPRQGSGSIKFHFGIGDTAPITPRRHLFTATEQLYLSFDVKLGTAGVPWQGSGAVIDPHLIQILTDADTSTAAAGFSFLSAYIEALQFIPLMGISDGARINVAQVGNNLLGSATTHGVAGGNGVPPGSNFSEFHSNGDGTYSDWAEWTYGNPGTGRGDGTSFFVNDRWHRVECFLKMNRIQGGLPIPDGVIRMWVDGTKVIDFTNLELRTAQYATQKFNQFVLAPTMSAGSPISQDMWIDNVLVADSPPDDDSGDFSMVGESTIMLAGGPRASGALSFTGTANVLAEGYSSTGGEPIYCNDLYLKSDVDRNETPLSYNPHLVSCLAKIPLADGDIGSDGAGDMQLTATAVATGDFSMAGSATLEMESDVTPPQACWAIIDGIGVMLMEGDGGSVIPPDTTVPPTSERGTGGTSGRNPWSQQKDKRRRIIDQEDEELVLLVEALAPMIYSGKL